MVEFADGQIYIELAPHSLGFGIPEGGEDGSQNRGLFAHFYIIISLLDLTRLCTYVKIKNRQHGNG